MKLGGSEKQRLPKRNYYYHVSSINVIGNQVYYLVNGSWVHKVDVYGENFAILNQGLPAIYVLAVPGRVYHLSKGPNTGYSDYYIETEGMNRNVLDWNFPLSIWRLAGVENWFVFVDGRGGINYIRKTNDGQWVEPGKIYEESNMKFVLETLSGPYEGAAIPKRSMSSFISVRP